MRAFLVALALCLLVPGRSARAQSVNADRTETTKLTLGKPVQVGAVAVVPILAERPLGQENYITLAEAIQKGLVEIVEIPGSEEVNSLEVRNHADRPLLLFAGELLLGGKQDRIMGKDTILPADASSKVPVFCVEHGRWHGETLSFEPADTIVPDNVRSTAAESQDQQKVWDSVAEVTEEAGTPSATGTVRALIRDPKVSHAVEITTAKLRRAFQDHPNAVGVICWLDGRIHSADLFANAPLFAASLDKLLRSYSADAQLAKAPKTVAVDREACAKFLEDIVRSRRALAERGAHEAIFKIKDGKITGYESGRAGFGGGFGGGGFGHGTYRPGGG